LDNHLAIKVPTLELFETIKIQYPHNKGSRALGNQ
jgi:hypothetical protein